MSLRTGADIDEAGDTELHEEVVAPPQMHGHASHARLPLRVPMHCPRVHDKPGDEELSVPRLSTVRLRVRIVYEHPGINYELPRSCLWTPQGKQRHGTPSTEATVIRHPPGTHR
jgi:hypothetical protein